jgi:osmotically-inducible protein OsmY
MSTDKQLQQTALDHLKWLPNVNAADIGVTAKDGIVTLTGTVETYAEKRAAEQAVLQVKGVKGVAEEIEVKLPFNTTYGDAEIAEAAANRLAWDVWLPKDAVKVVVSKGWVTLTGDVEWHYQHDAAADAICTLRGVTGVSNQIGIKPKANVRDIKSSIDFALHRSRWFQPETVAVRAVGGKVTLTGDVETADERSLAATTAWAAPGVTSVTNDIHVL